ncbi:GDP-mannose 4,6-dehydratase [Prochlorococcus sp. AH-736-F23]|nr:GDP-mannose 4,6-dehydratase [Prochlorococcus sp. AH-736-F23]
MSKKILVTGAAGFIGYHLCQRLLNEGFNVIGLDNLNSYYDVKLKEKRINLLEKLCKNKQANWEFFKGDLINKDSLKNIFKSKKPLTVFNLAAQAGVRYSIENPSAYINSNILGFHNLIELCVDYSVKNFIYASSSSVYGGNKKIPFSEKDAVDHPVSLYAATKRANELIAHSYSHLYGLPCIGLRFFTVYGPWGRPDMAPMIFAKAILDKQPINVFNNGDMFRDFTYIDDVIETMFRLIDKPARKNLEYSHDNCNPSESWAPYKILNVGNSGKVSLMNFIEILENELGEKSKKNFVEMQKGDVKSTSAETESIEKWTGFKPNTKFEKGIKEFANWFKLYYQKNENGII